MALILLQCIVKCCHAVDITTNKSKIEYLWAGCPGGQLHQGQFQVHNAHRSAMEQVLCLQCIHDVLWHLCKRSCQTVLPPVGVAWEGQGTGQTQLQMYCFLPKKKTKKTKKVKRRISRLTSNREEYM